MRRIGLVVVLAAVAVFIKEGDQAGEEVAQLGGSDSCGDGIARGT